MTNDLEIIELLVAKFCHDLAGPIGAISNGIEFIREPAASQHSLQLYEKAIALIEDSSRQSVSKVQFFRQAFGSLNVTGEANLTHLKQLSINLFANSKQVIDWPDAHCEASTIPLTNMQGKVVLNLILTVAGVLIHGGKISVRLQKNGNIKQIQVKGAGSNIKVDDEMLHFLQHKFEGYAPDRRNVHLHYLGKLITSVNAKLQVEAGKDLLQLTVDFAR